MLVVGVVPSNYLECSKIRFAGGNFWLLAVFHCVVGAKTSPAPPVASYRGLSDYLLVRVGRWSRLSGHRASYGAGMELGDTALGGGGGGGARY